MSKHTFLHRYDPARQQMLCGFVAGHYITTDKGLLDMTSPPSAYTACPDCLRSVERRQARGDAP